MRFMLMQHYAPIEGELGHLRTFTLAADERRDPNTQLALHLHGLHPARSYEHASTCALCTPAGRAEGELPRSGG